MGVGSEYTPMCWYTAKVLDQVLQKKTPNVGLSEAWLTVSKSRAQKWSCIKGFFKLFYCCSIIFNKYFNLITASVSKEHKYHPWI